MVRLGIPATPLALVYFYIDSHRLEVWRPLNRMGGCWIVTVAQARYSAELNSTQSPLQGELQFASSHQGY